MPAPQADLAAGFTTAVTKQSAASSELQHGSGSQIGRAIAMGSYFLTGVMAVNLSQIVGTPLYLINRDWYNAWIAFTKQSFGLLMITMTQYWAPTTIRMSGDKSMRGQLLKTIQGDPFFDFPDRMVLLANHQIYTDWLYIWYVAYCGGMHGRIYIVLKESLKRIPIIGWGMQFSKFIFLKRNWEKDKPNLARHLRTLNNRKEPMWLTIFPEGTNLAPSTRRASAKWAEKQRINDMRHQLLPRSTGLRFMLQELRTTVDWVYDITIAYEGVPRGQYAQDIFTLQASYAGGRTPKSVNMHFRRFRVNSIPLDEADAFDKWLLARWTEKDNLLEYYMQKGFFPADKGAERLPDGKIRRGAGHIEAQVRANKWYEFLQAFAPLGLFSMILYTFYGALPKKISNFIQKQGLQGKLNMLRKGVGQLGNLNQKSLGGPISITGSQLVLLKKAMAAKNITINQETITKALQAGFFKEKVSVPVNGKNKLSITNGSVELQTPVGKIKTGLTSAEKRAKAKQRQAAQAAPVANGALPNGKPPAPKPAATTPQMSLPTAKKPPKQPAIKATPTKPTAPAPVKKTAPTATNATAPSTKPSTASTKPTSSKSKPNPIAAKKFPKLGPPSSAETGSWTTTSSNTIPKLGPKKTAPNVANKTPANGTNKPITNGISPAPKKPVAATNPAAAPKAVAGPKPMAKKPLQSATMNGVKPAAPKSVAAKKA